MMNCIYLQLIPTYLHYMVILIMCWIPQMEVMIVLNINVELEIYFFFNILFIVNVYYFNQHIHLRSKNFAQPL